MYSPAPGHKAPKQEFAAYREEFQPEAAPAPRERTSLSGALRWTMFRKVPKGTNWFYTLGSATLFAIGEVSAAELPQELQPAEVEA